MLHIQRMTVMMLVLSLKLFVAFAGARQDAAAEFDERGEDNWVADIRPGVKLYGRRNRFAEVGPSTQFDLAPDSRTIAFAVKEQIKFWDMESQKVVDRIQLRVSAIDVNYSIDGRKLFVTHQPLTQSLPSGGPNPTLSVWNAMR